MSARTVIDSLQKTISGRLRNDTEIRAKTRRSSVGGGVRRVEGSATGEHPTAF